MVVLDVSLLCTTAVVVLEVYHGSACCRCVVDVGVGVRHHLHIRLFSHQLRLLPRVVRRPHGSLLPDHVRVHADDVPHGARQRVG